MSPYHFTGCAASIDRAAESLGMADARDRALARSQVPVTRVQSALGQAVNAKPDARAAIFAEALKWRAIAAVALAGIDAVIADAKQGLGLAEDAPSPPANPPEDTPSQRMPRRR